MVISSSVRYNVNNAIISQFWLHSCFCCGKVIFLISVAKGMKTEQDLVDAMIFSNGSIDNEKLYLAGIVFENPEEYNTGIPHNISYTIR